MKFVALVFCILMLGVGSKIYEPCSLASFLFRQLENHGEGVTIEIPLLVCVAGYHHFDTDYKAGNYTTTNRTIHEWSRIVEAVHHDYMGLFGLRKAEYVKLQSGNSSIALQALSFLKNVMHADNKNHSTNMFFRKICSRQFVRDRPCDMDDYVQFGFEVPVPRYPDMLAMFADLKESPVICAPGEPTVKPPAESPETTEKSFIFDSIVGNIIGSILFWSVTALVYVIRSRYWTGITRRQQGNTSSQDIANNLNVPNLQIPTTIH